MVTEDTKVYESPALASGRTPAGPAEPTDSLLDAIASGMRPDITDTPPAPDPPAYPEPSPAPTSAAASAEVGAGDGKTNKRFDEIERRLNICEDAQRTLADAEMVARIKDELLKAIEAAKAAILEEAMQSTTERLGGLKKAIDTERVSATSELAVGIEQRATSGDVTRVHEALGGLRGRVEGMEKRDAALGEADRRLEACITTIDAKLAQREGHIKDLEARLTEMDGVIAKFSDGLDMFEATVRGLRDAIRETRGVADGAVQHAAALDEFRHRAEAAFINIETDIASARAATQDVDVRLGHLVTRVGDAEGTRARVATHDREIGTLDKWREHFSRRLDQ